MHLWDRSKSPLPHLPWIIAGAFRAAPAELTLNLAASLTLGAAAGLTLPVTRRLVDLLAGGERAVPPFLINLALFGALLLVTEVAGAIAPVTMNYVQDKTARFTRYRVLEKAAGLALPQFDHAETYDLIHRATIVPGPAMSMAVIYLFQMVRTGISLVAAVLFVGAISPWVAAGACLIALPIGWAGARHGERMYGIVKAQSKESRMARYLTGLLTDRPAATELRAYGLLPFFIGRWQELFRRQARESLGGQVQSLKEGWLADLAAALLYLGALSYFTSETGSSALSAGTIVAVAGAIRLLRAGAEGMATSAGAVWVNALPLLDLRAFLDLPAAARPTTEGTAFPSPLSGGIRFERVSFRYPGKAEPVLSDLSFEIRAGERIALVGANGAGKSTLIKLLLGLYTPTAGRITVDGIDLQQIAPASLRASVSCVFQDFARYEMTASENIRLGRLEATPAEVATAAARAGAADLIASLPQQMDTMLGKRFAGGQELSGGQWQRIALARAFVREAQLLVLDEPTAALDPRAELDLFGKFVELVEGRTAILISHRLGVARLADRIFVLDDGRIAEQGTHAALLAAGGLYATLFRTQAAWYEEEVAS